MNTVKQENEKESRLERIKARFLSGESDKYQYSRELHANHLDLFDYSRWMVGKGIAEIRINRDGVYLETDGGLRFLLDPEDQYLPPTQLLNFGDYEADERELLFRILEPGMTVFDIGANIGWYALVIGKRMPESRIFAFEPIFSTFKRLRENVELNGLTNIEVLNHGLSHVEEEKTFYFSPEISGAASGADILGWKTVRTETCRVRRLDDVWREAGVCVDFIKCDVEGAELFVFQGAPECLRTDQPVIFCEMLRKWSAKFGYHLNQIIEMLAALDYQCYSITGKKLERMQRMEETTVSTNFLFLHKTKHASKVAALAGDGILVEAGPDKQEAHL